MHVLYWLILVKSYIIGTNSDTPVNIQLINTMIYRIIQKLSQEVVHTVFITELCDISNASNLCSSLFLEKSIYVIFQRKTLIN